MCVRVEQSGRAFHMETAGSLTPDLEGSPASLRHTVRTITKKKENYGHASKQPAKAHPRQSTRKGG